MKRGGVSSKANSGVWPNNQEVCSLYLLILFSTFLRHPSAKELRAVSPAPPPLFSYNNPASLMAKKGPELGSLHFSCNMQTILANVQRKLMGLWVDAGNLKEGAMVDGEGSGRWRVRTEGGRGS